MDTDEERIKNDIFENLKGLKKNISCVFFYDAKGSKLFEKITKLPEYYLTKTEINILKNIAPKFSNILRDVDIIEFGSGDCTKISILLEFVPKKYFKSICYMPVDVSYGTVEESSNILSKRFPGINIHGIVADFNHQIDVIPNNRKKIICFLGSTIGNFTISEAKEFLVKLASIMNPEDLLLAGFDMVKGKNILENAYNDSENITEQFNKNILNVVNGLIGTDFNSDSFDHVAFYNEELKRIEMHLRANKDLEITSAYFDSKINIKTGDTIHTENSNKFTDMDIDYLAKSSGLEIKNVLKDKNEWFSVVEFVKN